MNTKWSERSTLYYICTRHKWWITSRSSLFTIMDFMVCPKGVNAMKESRASPKRHQRVWTMIYNTGISPFVTGKSSSGYSLQPEPTAYSTQHPYATIQLGKTTITPRVLFQVLATGEGAQWKIDPSSWRDMLAGWLYQQLSVARDLQTARWACAKEI